MLPWVRIDLLEEIGNGDKEGGRDLLRSLNPDLPSLTRRNFSLPVRIHDFRMAIRIQFPHGATDTRQIGIPAEERTCCFCHSPTLLFGVSDRSFELET